MTTSDDFSTSFATHDTRALPVAAAQAAVRRWVQPVDALECVPLPAALGRVLAQDVSSPIDVPAYDNAAMDGYAFDSAVLTADATITGASSTREITLDVAGQAFAGHPFAGVITGNRCVRIMTGAQMPAGCDTVIPQELISRTGEQIVFEVPRIAPGANCRRAGEDLARGHPALVAGRLVRPADIGLLASLGVAKLTVRRRVRVAFFSTGDELRELGEPLDANGIYDSNRYTLAAMLTPLGIDALDLGIVRDEPAALDAAFRSAASRADVVITSGGVSVGDADLTRRTFERLGDIGLWQLAIRPGRPFAFGRLWPDGRDNGKRAALFFGLPGNPVAMMVTFHQIVREALLAISGAQIDAPLRFAAISAAAIKKRPGRTEYQRGVATRETDGSWRVTPTRSQSSASLNSMSEANCLIVLAHDQGDVAEGALVDIMPFDGLI